MTRLIPTAVVTLVVFSIVTSHRNVAAGFAHDSARVTTIEVLVEDANGMPVSGLSRDDFQVWSEGQQQPIDSFSAPSDSTSLTLVVLTDITASLLEGPLLAPMGPAVKTGSLQSIRPQIGPTLGQFELQGLRAQERSTRIHRPTIDDERWICQRGV